MNRSSCAEGTSSKTDQVPRLSQLGWPLLGAATPRDGAGERIRKRMRGQRHTQYTSQNMHYVAGRDKGGDVLASYRLCAIFGLFLFAPKRRFANQ